MYTLHIEHGITDLASWQMVYASDPLDRSGSGVVAERLWQPVEDSHRIVVQLDFAEESGAAAFLDRLRSQVWASPGAAPALRGAPEARILRAVSGGPPPTAAGDGRTT